MAAETSGSLIIAGSGIASIGHITLETLAHIKEADKIYYAVTDPATECYIQDNSRGEHFDLTTFYDTNKKRYESYVQMSEVMLRDVRAGHKVLGVFYGHPGVFVAPSHRAIAIARQEGYPAKMLPGVSAEDYMFADLGFDPSTYGCMTQEATELLVRNKKLDPSINNIIWQVGSVGVDTMVFNNAQFHLLVDRLEKDFGPDHIVVHYIGAILPQSVMVKDIFTIHDLRKEEVVSQFTTTSTFYVPPRTPGSIDAKVVRALGLSDGTTKARASRDWTGFQPTPPAYGVEEMQSVAAMESFIPSQEKQVVYASPAMRSLTADLALSPKFFEQYQADPVATANTRDGLTVQEKFALGLGKSGPIFSVMRALPSAIASGQEKNLTALADGVEGAALAIVAAVVFCI